MKTTDTYCYSICMSCKNFDIYKKDDGEYECKCGKGRKIITPNSLAATMGYGIKEENCSHYKKAHKLPWWYKEVSGFPEIKRFKGIHKNR